MQEYSSSFNIKDTVEENIINVKFTESDSFNLSFESAVISGNVNPYEGSYVVTPLPYDDVILPTDGKTMLDDVRVLEIPHYITSNINGQTMYIG